MRFSALTRLLCGTACLVVALSASAQPPARIGGTYAGRYQCNIWNTSICRSVRRDEACSRP